MTNTIDSTHPTPTPGGADNDQVSPTRKRLGLWHRPDANYSFGLGERGSVIAVIGLIAFLAAFIPQANRVRNLMIVAIIVAIAVGGFVKRDRWGRSVWSIMRFEAGWWWHRSSGRTYYAPVWFSAVPVSKSGLPGLLSDVSILEQPTVDGATSFGVVIQPASQSATVVFETWPAGSAMSTSHEIAEYEDRWDRWLASTCQEPDIISIQVVTEAAGGDREELDAAVDNLIKRPETKAAQILTEVANTLNASERTICRTWVAVSWRTKRRDLHLNALPARIERIRNELADCGAGPTEVLSRNAICRVWAAMWEPDRRPSLAKWPDQTITLDSITPATQETRQMLRLGDHDAVTLSIGTAPTQTIGTKALHQLARGIDGAAAIRWAELWRPVQPTEARQWLMGIERGIETRMALSTNRRRARIEDEVDDNRHRNTATALVEGANLIRFGFAITATLDPGATAADRYEIVERIRQKCGPLAVQLRVQNGAHLPGFVATLPGGIPLPEVVQQPDPTALNTGSAEPASSR